MQTSLKGINNRAVQDGDHRFGGLYRLLNVENLRWAYNKLNKKAASGIDNISHTEYGENLEENLKDLVKRLKHKTYKAKLVRRKYIPKSKTKMRPLGIPALEDKIVQYAAGRILESIFEADFIKQSYGYRRGCGAQDAIRKIERETGFGPYGYIVEADIKGFFDNISHDWLLQMVELRVDDKAFVNLIRKWLKAGILEENMVIHPDTGTPQGGVISPVLANIYLHYALDLWFKKVVSKRSEKKCQIIRYADDFICLFQSERDARVFFEQLSGRLAKFNLAVAPEKTALLNFSRFKVPEKNGSFVFLGFEFRREVSRKGKPLVTRRTAKKKLQAKIADFKEWVKKNCNLKLRSLMATVRRKYTGHYNYYGCYWNTQRIYTYFFRCNCALFKWLNKRSQRRSYTREEFNEMLKRYDIPTPESLRKSKVEKRRKKQDQQIILPGF